MDNDIRSQVKLAAEAHGVDKPIMSYRVVGGRLELYLLGGSVVYHKLYHSNPIYRDMGLAELKKLATSHKIPGRSKMNRIQLIEALEEVNPNP
jgi:hypothetical protein